MKTTKLLISKRLLCLLLIMLAVLSSAFAQNQTEFNSQETLSSIFDVFSNLGAPPQNSSGTINRVGPNDNWEVGTEWYDFDGFDESVVFKSELNVSSNDIDYSIRIGKGGHLYSVKFPESDLGELMPPQFSDGSAWNDDCYMTTYIWNDIHFQHPDEVGKYGKGQVHGSGMYMFPELDPLNNYPFYCPSLGEYYDPATRTLSEINIPTIPNPTINRADLLKYVNYRDVGDGVLEVTYYAYNFHDYTINGAATPWGGIRHSKLPYTVIGTTGNNYEERGDDEGAYNIKDYGNGWIANTRDLSDPENSWTMSFVHGRDRHYATERQKFINGEETFQTYPTVLQNGYGGRADRDFEIINFANRLDLKPGEGYFRRVFYIFGKFEDVVEKSVYYADYTDYGEIVFNENTATKRPLYISVVDSQNVLTPVQPNSSSQSVAEIYAVPLPGSIPLFQMKNIITGEYILSTDQYAVCGKLAYENPFSLGEEAFTTYENRHIYQMYDRTTEWVSLLGYVMPNSNPDADEILLSTVLGSTVNFVAGENQDSDELVLIKTNEIENCVIVDTALIEAECYTNMSGITTKYSTENNSDIVEYVNDGDWIMFNNIDLSNVNSVKALCSSNRTGGNIEFRLDSVTGTLISTINITNTVSWTNWETFEANIDVSVSGTHDLYLVFTGNTGYLFNINSFGFEQSDSLEFTPDPTKTYYIDAPHHNLRLAADGESENPYTTSTSTTGADVEWQFVDNNYGSWHVQRAAEGTNPRLRTDNTEYADMQPTAWNGLYTYYRFSSGAIDKTYFFTLPDGPLDFQRLQINNNGIAHFVPTSHAGTWESLRITEVGSTSNKLIDEANTLGVLIYPNPITNSTTVYGAEDSVIKIYDINGKALLNKYLLSENEEIDLSLLTTGVYYAQIFTSTKTIIKKIVKK